MDRKVYTVSAVNWYVKRLLQQDMLLTDIWVCGEISNFKRHSSGHLYFSLKDETASVSAVMFAGDARSLRFLPANGDQVQVQGYVSLYEKTGQYQLYVRQMQQQGAGALYQAFEALKDKLNQQGLFDAERKKPIPAFPRKIGMVTSPTGAAVRDMIQIARRRYPGVSLVLYPALVQGAEAADSLVEGIRCLDQMPEIDTIIVGRGGGSMEDLWPFNEEKVALAIAEASTPIISAVGHEIDFTIADFVADLRAPTPSAAAELAVPDVQSVLEQLKGQRLKALRSLTHFVQEKKGRLEMLGHTLRVMDPRRRLDEERQRLDMMAVRQRQRMDQYLLQQKDRVAHLASVLELTSPMHALSKGYTLLTDEVGRGVTSVHQVTEGQLLTARLYDGALQVKVENTMER